MSHSPLGPQVLSHPDILSSIEPLPRARPRTGLWDPGDSQSCRGDRDGWRGGSLNFQGREGEV